MPPRETVADGGGGAGIRPTTAQWRLPRIRAEAMEELLNDYQIGKKKKKMNRYTQQYPNVLKNVDIIRSFLYKELVRSFIGIDGTDEFIKKTVNVDLFSSHGIKSPLDITKEMYDEAMFSALDDVISGERTVLGESRRREGDSIGVIQTLTDTHIYAPVDFENVKGRYWTKNYDGINERQVTVKNYLAPFDRLQSIYAKDKPKTNDIWLNSFTTMLEKMCGIRIEEYNYASQAMWELYILQSDNIFLPYLIRIFDSFNEKLIKGLRHIDEQNQRVQAFAYGLPVYHITANIYQALRQELIVRGLDTKELTFDMLLDAQDKASRAYKDKIFKKLADTLMERCKPLSKEELTKKSSDAPSGKAWENFAFGYTTEPTNRETAAQAMNRTITERQIQLERAIRMPNFTFQDEMIEEAPMF